LSFEVGEIVHATVLQHLTFHSISSAMANTRNRASHTHRFWVR
jgi:hypothetical protein